MRGRSQVADSQDDDALALSATSVAVPAARPQTSTNEMTGEGVQALRAGSVNGSSEFGALGRNALLDGYTKAEPQWTLGQ